MGSLPDIILGAGFMRVGLSVLTLVAAAVFAAPALAQPPADPAVCGTMMPSVPPPPRTQAAWKITDLRQGLTMLAGDGSNMALLSGPDGVFLVDAQHPTDAQANLAQIEAMTGARPKFLVNTHSHPDHTGGNGVFGQAGAIIIASEETRERVIAQNPGAKAAWPVVTVQDSLDFHLDGQTIRVFRAPLPAHTDGDLLVYFVEADVLHMGDIYMKNCFSSASGGSQAGIIAAFRRALEITGPGTKFIPGHGELADRKDMEETLAMHEGARAAVEKLVKSGATLEQAVAAKPLAQWTPRFGPPGSFVTADAYVTVIYNELKK